MRFDIVLLRTMMIFFGLAVALGLVSIEKLEIAKLVYVFFGALVISLATIVGR